MTGTTWWCEHAWRGGDSVADGVLLTVAESQAVTIYVGLDGKGEIARPQKAKKRVTK